MVFLTERINFRQEKHSGLSKNKRGVSRPGVGHFPLSPTGYFLSLAKEGHSAPRHGELSFVSDGLFSFSSGKGIFRAPARVTFGRSPKSDQKVCLKPKVSRLPARYVPLLSAACTTRSRGFYFVVRIKGLSLHLRRCR